MKREPLNGVAVIITRLAGDGVLMQRSPGQREKAKPLRFLYSYTSAPGFPTDRARAAL